jgi:hypothetical protein
VHHEARQRNGAHGCERKKRSTVQMPPHFVFCDPWFFGTLHELQKKFLLCKFLMDDCGAKRNRRVSYEEAEDEGGPVTRRKLHAGSPGALATPAPRAVTDLE